MTAPLSGKILVADDDDAFRSMLAEYLARHGCEVLQATHGLEALLHVKHESPRAVIIDVTMPRLGGFEAVKRIRDFNPAIRVVVITGNTEDPDIVRQARRYDAVLLLKPLELPTVLTALGISPSSPTGA
jgi:CheY-like chemotaxis protein